MTKKHSNKTESPVSAYARLKPIIFGSKKQIDRLNKANN